MVAGKLAVPGGGSFEEHLGGTVGVEHQAEAQAPVLADGNGFGFAYLCRQGIEPVAEGRNRVVATVRPAIDGERVALMGGGCRQIGRKVGKAIR